MSDKESYQLQDGISKVHRSGLILEAGETVDAYPDILNDHGDVLEEVDGDGEESDGE